MMTARRYPEGLTPDPARRTRSPTTQLKVSSHSICYLILTFLLPVCDCWVLCPLPLPAASIDARQGSERRLLKDFLELLLKMRKMTLHQYLQAQIHSLRPRR